MNKANAIQLYVYARGIQRQKQQDKAFELYRQNAKKYPNDWPSHLGMARVDSAAGNFDQAAKEMKIAVDATQGPQKTALEGLLKRLQAKDDINK
jgi:tetratricopeptide (TPR) repeat protein